MNLLDLRFLLITAGLVCPKGHSSKKVNFPSSLFITQRAPSQSAIGFIWALKLNTAGVIPPIFASSILLFPATVAGFSGEKSEFMASLSHYLGHGKALFILLYVFLIMFFSFFYTAVVFNSEETANNLRKHGAYVAGKRPGKNTSEYFDYLLTRLTVIGGLYLSVVCVVPELLMNKYSVAFALGGTSFLIVVNVVIDTFTQIQTHLFSSRYEGLVKKMKLKER